MMIIGRRMILWGHSLKKRSDDVYEMFESSFSPSDVLSIRKVRKKAARRCALGYSDFSKLRKLNPVTGILSESATEFTLRDGRRLYFQLIDKAVENLIRDNNKETII